MNTYYRWLPNGAAQFSYHEEHARSKVREVYPQAHFEPHDDPERANQRLLVAWADAAAFQLLQEPVAEIGELS